MNQKGMSPAWAHVEYGDTLPAMAMNAENLATFETTLNRLASEIVLAAPKTDEGLLPAYSLLSDLADACLEDDVLTDSVTRCRQALDGLLDQASPWTEPTIAYVSEFVTWAQTALTAVRSGKGVEVYQSIEAFTAAKGRTCTESAAEEPASNDACARQKLADDLDVLLSLNLEADRELLGEFQTEALEHLEAIEQATLVIENEPEDADSMSALFRAFHTIKGVAGFLNLGPVQGLAHEVESLLDHARNGKFALDSSLINLVLEARDTLQQQVDQISLALDKNVLPSEVIAVSDLVWRVQKAATAALAGEPIEAAPEAPAEAEPAPSGDAKGFFDQQPQSLDEPVADFPRNGQPGEDAGNTAVALPEVEPAVAAVAKGESAASSAAASGSTAAERATVRVNTLKLDNLMDMVGELVIVQSQLAESAREEALENTPMQRNLSQLHRITKELQHTSMALRMVPIKPTFQKTSRLVRDLARKCDKKIHLILEGEDTELDRTVVEQIGDPLVHMVRNAIDHGVESPQDRVAAGKPEEGTVRLSAYHLGSNIVIELSDDGRGMDRNKILAKARERGLCGENDSFTDAEIFQFIFMAGFSTAAQVTDVSGRGVGMDVVRKNIERLRGTVEIASELGKGSVFKVKLPLTMAIIDGLVVRVGEDKFILPTTSVKAALRATSEQLATIQGRAEVLDLRGKTVPIVRLHERFCIQTDIQSLTDGIIVITEHFGKPYGLLVDEMISKQEVVIKSLGNLMQGLEGVAGGAILGDGTIALILDPSTLFSFGGG
ncbi:MAG: chemotaxis protein CheA [Opitutales bacterium]